MSDVFRRKEIELTPEQEVRIDGIKELAQKLYDYVTIGSVAMPAGGKDIATGKLRLEEAVMWFSKGFSAPVPKGQPKPNAPLLGSGDDRTETDPMDAQDSPMV